MNPVLKKLVQKVDTYYGEEKHSARAMGDKFQFLVLILEPFSVGSGFPLSEATH